MHITCPFESVNGFLPVYQFCNSVMPSSVVSGPLSLLQRSANERQRIRVVTRNARHVRGICTGFLVAFDKHCNLVSSYCICGQTSFCIYYHGKLLVLIHMFIHQAMVDVDEVYKNPREKPTIPKKKKRRKRNVILKAVTQMKGASSVIPLCIIHTFFFKFFT